MKLISGSSQKASMDLVESPHGQECNNNYENDDIAILRTWWL